ncbi:MAG TPA: cobalamin-binding protein [Candidatus Acidoferrales bacterium]|nr:cobalamin-binding protein [Candidatus Acidoferrales bacterium]
MQICSLLPSATEILFALGLGDSVAGVTHECDFPPAAAKKPALIRPRLNLDVSPGEMDRQVNDMIARGESIYAVDADLLAKLAPDLIVTQDLCHVCTVSPDDLGGALARLSKRPRVLSLTPHTLADVWEDIRRVGDATHRRRDAQALALAIEQQVAAIEMQAARASARPRVLCLEWLDPFYVGGHWVPEMVSKAGGEDVLGMAGKPSFKVTAEQIAQSHAEIILVMPCGYNAVRAAAEWRAFNPPESWHDLPAIRQNRIFAVDANSYFSRPGPRLADGVAILAHILHPEIFLADCIPSDSLRRA